MFFLFFPSSFSTLRLHRSLSSLKYGIHSTGGDIHLSISSVLKYGIHSTGGDIHLSILKRAIFHRGGTMESFIFKVWEAASAKIIHLSISCVLKYGKLPAQRSSISPFHWFGLPCFSRWRWRHPENRGCVRMREKRLRMRSSCSTLPATRKINQIIK